METEYRKALHWLFTRTRSGAARAPHRMQALLHALQLPVPPKVVHVAGTNGKGTVTHTIAAGLNAAGIRAGRFISPHVQDFTERIEAAGIPISQGEVTAAVQRYRQLSLQPAPAFFELTLALALEHFRQQQVGIAVIEAGVGARNDATITLHNTVVTVLTSIALDHTDVLGSTISEIALDKAAAIRPGIPVVTAEEGEALAVIETESARQGSLLLHPRLQPELFALPRINPAAASLAAGTTAALLPEPGSTRWLNLRLAAAALRQLGVGEAAVLAALQAPPLPGRGELFSIGGARVLLDGAHDPAAAVALKRSLRAFFPATSAAEADLPYTLIFAAQQRKQVLATLEPLAEGAARVILTSVNGQEPLQGTRYERIADPQQALDAALKATPPGGLIVIAGSLYLAGTFRSLFMPRR